MLIITNSDSWVEGIIDIGYFHLQFNTTIRYVTKLKQTEVKVVSSHMECSECFKIPFCENTSLSVDLNKISFREISFLSVLDLGSFN